MKFTSFTRKLLTLLMDNSVKVEYEVEGKKKNYEPELLKTHNEYMSKVKLLDMALQKKPIPLNMDEIPEEDKKALNSASGLWEAGLKSLTGIIRKENYERKAKELEQRILGCLKQNG